MSEQVCIELLKCALPDRGIEEGVRMAVTGVAILAATFGSAYGLVKLREWLGKKEKKQ